MKNSESRRSSYRLPKLCLRWYRQHGRRLFLKLQATVAIVSLLGAYMPVPAIGTASTGGWLLPHRPLAPLHHRPRVFRRRRSLITRSRSSCGRAAGTSASRTRLFPTT